MLSQDDIDAVLDNAQQSLDTLVDDVGRLSSTPPPTSNPTDGGSGAGPFPAAASHTGGTAGGEAAPRSRVPLEKILRLKVPVTVRLAESKLPLGEVLKIVPGTILEFTRHCDEELDLLVVNHQIGRGVAVKVDEHFGLRVSRMGAVRQRLESMKR